MFIFNTKLLMIGVHHWYELIIVIAAAVLAMLSFAAGTQGFFLVKCRIWETVALLAIALLLFRPGIVWDKIFPPLIEEPATKIVEYVGDMDPGSSLRMTVAGEKMNGKKFKKTLMLTIGEETTGTERLEGLGIETREEDGKVYIDNVVFGSVAEKSGIDFDQEILHLQVPSHRLPPELMYFPAVGLYALLYIIQARRRKKEQPAPVAA
jgi:hypothetical protein